MCAILHGLVGAACLAADPPAIAQIPQRPIDFNRDVRPILSDNCFHCHGRDKAARKAQLRLDKEDELKEAVKDLLERVSSSDSEEVMPPPKSGKKLTATQKDTLKRWAAAGAPWSEHWAFVAPKKSELPAVKNAGWPRTPVDQFILARLEAEGLAPSPEADKISLLRRVTLDLSGLPPTPEDVAAFAKDAAPDAYERAVDRLLASPHYGEHMAHEWLDQARYADTHGYFTDHERFMWRWRDWVIDAFNANMPYDRFTIEQLAGDLLPNPTTAQLIATGFNRNHMVTEESGIIEEEYRTEYVIDRVKTTTVVWLGLTAGCAQCHDHKYDPLTQKEYYSLFAYFNNVPEKGISRGKMNAAPILTLETNHDARVKELENKMKPLENALLAAAAADGDTDVPENIKPHKLTAEEKIRLETELRELKLAVRELLLRNTASVMQEMPKARDTFVLQRGQYDHPGDKVEAGVPAFLPPLPKDSPPNRLSFARWLVDGRNPLTARVAVNRLWRQLFGQGIVGTVEDFGMQGDAPTHPELLDWLAVEFVASGWDVKKLQRLLVTSAVYRQSSSFTPGLLHFDPRNKLLARMSRLRLDAEVIRDAALQAAGLLVEKTSGPSVKPYQPADLWKHIIYDKKNTQVYEQGRGEDLYRRSLYTYWKRQVPPPVMQVFDAPSRETCTLRRQRTNTPLQALALLNDTQFVEAARVLGARMRQQKGNERERVSFGFKLVTSRRPTAAEADALVNLLKSERKEFKEHPEQAAKLVQIGDAPLPEKIDATELAAWTVIGNLLLNLDEALNRE